MKAIVITLILLAAGIWLGIALHNDPGYVLIAYQHWSIESSLWVAGLSLIIIFLIVYVILRLIAGTLTLSHRLTLWSGSRKKRKAIRLTQKGLYLLAQGHWQQAQHLLESAAEHYPTPVINYLAAARAAQELGDLNERDSLLKLAAEQPGQNNIAVGLTQASLQIDADQWEQAIATLKHIQDLDAKNTYALKLLQQTYQHIGDWIALQKLLPTLKKYRVLTSSKLIELEKSIYLQRLKAADESELSGLWQSMPRSLKTDSALLHQYCLRLLKHGDSAQAYYLIHQQLKKQWDIQLLRLLTHIDDNDLSPTLKFLESKLPQHNNAADCLFTLGKICQRMQLWGKAEDYLKRCLSLQPQMNEAHLALAQVYIALNEKEQALHWFEKALKTP